jgi:hypothetical protein
MFFFASDNTLSPSMLSQLKALKSAGFQKNTNVLVHFDPNANGAPTRFFEINKNERREQKESRIGDGREPFVSDLAGDNIPAEEIIRTVQGEEARMFAGGLSSISELEAGPALDNFLNFCRVAYPAEHYMLFLVGHGMVVGRDAFLPDDNPHSSIGLSGLGEILRNFTGKIAGTGVLELIAMHSCSMSSVEVAYELKGTANYMLASQGVSFMGAWNYRHFLIKVFNAIEAGKREVDVHELMTDLHRLCIHNSADFIFAGYSADVCLSQLRLESVTKMNEPIKNLSEALTDALDDPRCCELILLAHWKSQSHWHDTYTDLYDFCLCLSESCKDSDNASQRAIKLACAQVIQVLGSAAHGGAHDDPVVSSDYFGPDYQYCHGLSIYFPWARPIDTFILDNYRRYLFTTEFTEHSWLRFLTSYFDKTLRKSRVAEERRGGNTPDFTFSPAFKTASASFSKGGVLGGPGFTSSTALEPRKISPPDSGSGECYCLSVKNYPREFAISPGTLELFNNHQEDGNEPRAAA